MEAQPPDLSWARGFVAGFARGRRAVYDLIMRTVVSGEEVRPVADEVGIPESSARRVIDEFSRSASAATRWKSDGLDGGGK